MKDFLEKTLKNKFDSDAFCKFSLELFNDLDINKKELDINSQFADYVDKLDFIGEYKDQENKKIHVLEVKLKTSSKLKNARSAQRNIISKHLKDYWADGALVAFYASDDRNWRLSFVKIDYKFDDKGKTKEELSPAKRYSFLVGENEPSHTAQQQLLPLVREVNYNPTFSQIESAFGVERVTKEFFEEYKKLFESLVKDLDSNRTFRNEALKNNINTENFTKKLLGQIVFLYFLQKKGWLGVPADEQWGNGDQYFLRTLFDDAINKEKNFFNDYLEILFYDTLNNPRRRNADPSFSRDFNCRIPFLNGGLFEPEYNWANTIIYLENHIFKNILDVFDLYNFTVKEDDPLEKEVAVDPEMLGKVFENLLEENLRKGKGTYYTPREIVHYMCQESLINYLITESGVKEEEIRFLVLNHGFEFKEGKEVDSAKKINNLLKDIKVVDPACGSGAFLVGMLQEITKAREVTELLLGNKAIEYQIKKETIQNCIYGVDIDPGAVDIAKLRLWLSLVVDYEVKDIEPLPNLDYKIMQGNSLLEELVLGDRSIKLFDSGILGEKKKMKNLFEEEKQKDIFENINDYKEIIEKLTKLQRNYFEISDLEEKKKIRDKIEKIEHDLIKENVDKEIKRLKNEGGKLEFRTQGGINKKDIDKFVKNLSKQSQIMNILEDYEKSKVRPFFLWHLYFADVFERKGGFDIVIANPPYVRQEEIKNQKRSLEKAGYQVYNSTSDLYTYFYEKAWYILKPKGICSFISSNKWLRAKYGEKLRGFLDNTAKILQLIDFNGYKIFEATVDTNIILFKKQKSPNNYEVPFINIEISFDKDRLEHYFREYQQYIKKDNLKINGWSLINKDHFLLKSKIEEKGISLKDWDIKIYFGIKTGFSKAFIINEKVKNELSAREKKSAKIIKPILRGRDIGKYHYDFGRIWLINTEYDLNIPELYPIIYNYLKKFKKELINREDKGKNWWNLRACTYYKEFDKEKIIYQEITNDSSFTWDNKKMYVNQSSYIISNANKYVLAMLNSKLVNFYFKQIASSLGAGAYRWIKQYVERIPIPKITKKEEEPFTKLVDKILDITKSDDYLTNENKQKKVGEYEKKIDEMVYKLYGLTEKEIKIIEYNENN